jgi:hypothetical protein
VLVARKTLLSACVASGCISACSQLHSLVCYALLLISRSLVVRHRHVALSGTHTLCLHACSAITHTCYNDTLLQLRAELAAAHRELEAARREAAAAVTQADVSQQRARHLETENATVTRHCSQEDRRLSQWSDELSALQSRLTERARDLEQVRVAVCYVVQPSCNCRACVHNETVMCQPSFVSTAIVVVESASQLLLLIAS